MKEQWTNIKGGNGWYQISNCGRVRCLTHHVPIRNGRFTRLVKGHLMKIKPSSKGYPSVRLKLNDRSVLCLVHRLMALAFIPNPNDKPEVNHKNGIKTDNRLVNLEWVTASEQRFHAYRTGLQRGAQGSKSPNTLLTEEQIPDIRRRIANGERQSDIARTLGVSFWSINLIKRGLTWRHVPCPPQHDLSRVNTYARGTNNLSSKLTDRKVRSIRKLLHQGKPQSYIARKFRISQGVIGRIGRGLLWCHVK